MQLHNARSYMEGIAEPLSYTEIHAWSRLMQVMVVPIEVDVLKALDVILINQSIKERSAK